MGIGVCLPSGCCFCRTSLPVGLPVPWTDQPSSLQHTNLQCIFRMFVWRNSCLDLYFVWWVVFFTNHILKVFISNSTKYSSAYQSKPHTEMETTVFYRSSIQGCKILKFTTTVKTVRDRVHERGIGSVGEKNQSYWTSSKFLSRITLIVEYRFIFFHMHRRTEWIKRKILLIYFGQVYVAYLNKKLCLRHVN